MKDLFGALVSVPLAIFIRLGHLLRAAVYRVTGCDRRVPVVYLLTPVIAVLFLASGMAWILVDQWVNAALDGVMAVWIMIFVGRTATAAHEMDEDRFHQDGVVQVSAEMAATVFDIFVFSVILVLMIPPAISRFVTSNPWIVSSVLSISALLVGALRGGVALDPDGTGGKTLPELVRSLASDHRLAGEGA